jgi:hypothetical protein
LDQSKDADLDWHEAMVNAIIDIFGMTYEESFTYFKRLENLENQAHQRSSSGYTTKIIKKEFLLPVV